MSSTTFVKDTFGGLWEKAALDLSKLVVAGHSFGGITAVGTTCADRRVKACIGLDPWFFPHYKELNAGKFAVKSADQHVCLIMTETFPVYRTDSFKKEHPDFDCGGSFHKFLKDSRN